ncbi:helix-turn-helix transcriptional regulator (plasmid) [Arsenophonus nasoniae]|uniref:Bacterial regulatory protein, luxR family n=1 Tax=Arsenophonus nasoniae TaxID=638 RepID=A0A4P7L4D8_9GAMM|nr:helix-turn-helix transcriptional regulator [Arsenophonus nasoniae]QBY45940.1 Bacterial regulatory protein, luxR family [Arsenophonus nasoniae]QBY46104.1 Bacterial regulatory protein, luxR family [Arsenophonus nasoniae]WGM08506.1 helix-turn-helix transcriptional regulator [Arsenophonus nasoniae]WGM13763.1 helix-turn-helix transcriptional regulator [Arsenophonus nasoniae]WGM18389.1 helix-turn-helix transcriptional regulator [Arsenophonus nasoniae]
MKSEMIKFFLSSGVPCGFVDSEGEFQMNLTMSDLLHSMIFSAELKTLIEKVHAEKLPFSLMCNLPANFKKSPTVWHFHFLPLFCSENGYLGTFFHAHEFLFLSPMEYVDGMQPYAVTTEKPNKLFTDRERDVLFLAFQRLSLKEIARRLDIGTRTVGHHLNIIYEKADVHSACQLRAFCKSKGF